MKKFSPPRIYITSVEDCESAAAANQTPTTPPPTPQQHPHQQRPIPSIDLTMALNSSNKYGGSYDDNVSADEMQQINVGALGTTLNQREPSIKDHQNDEGGGGGGGCAKGWAIWSQPLALLAIFVLLWGVAYSILPRELTDPDTPMMRLCFLFIGAQTAGVLCTLVGLPDMLGMLFWGVLYTNVGLADFKGLLRVEAFLRDMALINIMLLAGLGLDYDALKKLFRIIMQLTVIPTAAEVIAITVLSRYLLDLPWLWGVLLGLVITAISPNVVVTVMLRLAEQGLGRSKGIRTMILATTSCNDVLSIFLFGVFLGVIFSTGNLTSQILQGPIGIVIGLVFGGACGLLLLYLPSYQSKYTNGLRFTVTILAGTLAVVGSRLVGYPSAGALGCIMTSFVAGTGWKRRLDYDTNEVGSYLDLLWKFLKPVSFSLIGKEVNFDVLEGSMVLYGTITLLVAVAFRLIFSYLSTLGSDLNWKEKAYVTLSGFPKATVQAALGPAALDLARSLNSPTVELERAQTVLIVTVVAIILTAPLGALLMVKLAPRWLKKILRREFEYLHQLINVD